MSIVTGSGDDGKTSLFGGDRVSKSHLRIEAYGTVDEAQSAIGMIRSAGGISGEIDRLLSDIQKDLFVVGADLASPDPEMEVPRVSSTMIENIEKEIKKFEEKLPELKSFILPSGTPAASVCFWARAVVRRAERNVARLHDSPEIRLTDVPGDVSTFLVYLNRLGDLLFLAARAINHDTGAAEETWPGK